jgi:gamma-glutamyl hercynylcysteine S-oxide synthase
MTDAAPVDPVLQRLHRELPALLPRYGTRWEQYLMSWQPVIDDERGGLRGKLRVLRNQLRGELGIPITREKPAWDRRIVVSYKWFLYEKRYIDLEAGGFRVDQYVADTRRDFGFIDEVILWQAYPRLGIDHRSQFDYYRDLPGGLQELTRVIRFLHEAGIRAFLAYNPWDVGSRREPLSDADTLASLLKDTGADGVFLDTVAAADRGFLDTLRRERRDAAVYPELVPPLVNLPWLGGCWQQFTVPTPPLALIHKWLDPRFCPRLVDRYARSHAQELAIAFLHGTGHVVWENVFGWWNPWSDDDRLLLKKTSAILKGYEDFFRDPDWEPYVSTGIPGVYAMEWHLDGAVLFTLYNTNDRGVEEITLRLPEGSPPDLVDVWNGRELRSEDGRTARCSLPAGGLGCIAAGGPARILPFAADAGDPRRHSPVTLDAYKARPLPVFAALPARRRRGSAAVDRRMQLISGGRYVMRVHRAVHPDMEGGIYSDISHPTAKSVPDQYFWLEPYEVDRTPVTKAGFQAFLAETRYRPAGMHNFLADWSRPPATELEPWRWAPPQGREQHPVTWVSLDEARAYAAWASLLLPTEAQWQRAAEGPQENAWPWGSDFDPHRCNGDSPDTTPVDAFPAGASAEGVLDLCGNVWEWTESERDDGHMRYVMVRGGCHLRVTGSSWYTASGAQPCGVHEKVPLLADGIDRLATVGFRCVRPHP